MSETLDAVATELDQRQLAAHLLAQAKNQGMELVGPNGLVNQLNKNVLVETVLNAEMTEHLGYDKHDPARARQRSPALRKPRRSFWVPRRFQVRPRGRYG